MKRPTPCRLQFDPARSLNAAGKHVRDGLSAVLRTGDNLWLACDEHTTVERLRLLPDGSFGQHTSFSLAQMLDLPGGEAEEIDIEGLAESDGYLWVIGSHSRKRKEPKPDHPDQVKQIGKLAQVQSEANRYLLARIPLVLDAATGDYSLLSSAPDPAHPGRTLRTGCLRSSGHTNELLRLLKQDEHLAPFLSIPGKDNGFDIEGLAAASGGRLFVGLRGPVLRGWAVVLELQLRADKHHRLRLDYLPGTTNYYHKHFLDLNGMGLRELRLVGPDLYLLAGPTMDLDGSIAVYRWANALRAHADHVLHHPERVDRLFDVPHRPGQDKAEGMATFDRRHLLIVFDSPSDARKSGADAVTADLYALPRR
ncbi:DUF3616 domain-containing protein [Hymenobacter coalescens]